ncbi:MAG: hypothetical protein WEB88_16820 [Gemmatimonadota bacterium]
MLSIRRLAVPVLMVTLSLLAAALPAAAQLPTQAFDALQPRSIGPAGMSGRVADIDVQRGSPGVIYVGAATGGLWRSPDGGLTWTPIFDDAPAQGIGAVAVSPAAPEVVWAGTGEGNPRNSAGVGYGLYKSQDGGQSWRGVGFEDSERIHRVIAHPTDPDVAYVGVMGPAWSDGTERGVYRTTDGGRSWDHILYVDERTGVADLVMDPANPDKLFAAMWEYRRWPWFFESGGPGSGLYVTEDGGTGWTRIGAEAGLPEGDLGRIGVAIHYDDPSIVYALVEAENSALVRSDDGGRSWRTVNSERGIANRPFYYADIRVDPRDPERVYNLFSSIQVSTDGGRNFETVVSSSIIHGDVHELWIDPEEPNRLIMGNDGGIAFSYDYGETWRFVENLPVGQFYHVEIDHDVPYNVYGGMQDNGSWYGPSAVWESRGIANAHWRRVGGGDGFWVSPDYRNPRFGYSQSQGGNLARFDKVTGERQGIRPRAEEGEERLRFNWNAGFHVDAIDSATIYLGSQFVHRSRDYGETWEIISPDLTTNDPEKQQQSESGGLTRENTGAETHTTIVSIATSQLTPGVLWVGTDDGNVQLSRNGGRSWENVGRNIPDVPAGTWVPHVEPSKHDPATAYVVFDDHRRGNWQPYVFRTTDWGRTWTSLATADLFGFMHALEEDHETPDLLFLGGEFGLWVSVDGGGAWTKWDGGFPAVPVRSLVIHPRDHDLVLGTHGRAIWILDDIQPVRELARRPALAGQPLAVFEPAPAIAYNQAEGIGYRSTGMAMQFGESRPRGVLLTYWLGSAQPEGVEVEVFDAGGEVVATLSGPGEYGMNRVRWDLRMQAPEGEGGFRGGREALPGAYVVRVSGAGVSATTLARVLPDSRAAVR